MRVYPPPGYCCEEDAVLLLGAAPSQATSLSVSGGVDEERALALSPEGFFADSVALSPGENALTLRAHDHQGVCVAEERFEVTRRPSRALSGEEPLWLDADAFTLSAPCWLQPGDSLLIQALASPGARVEVDLPGLLDAPLTLTPTTNVTPDGRWADTRVNRFGALHWAGARWPAEACYEAVLTIPAEAPSCSSLEGRTFDARLSVLRGDEAPRRADFPQCLTIGGPPLMARVDDVNQAVLRVLPSVEAARLTPQPLGTRLTIDGALGEWRRARLGGRRYGWTLVEALCFEESRASLVTPLRWARVTAESDFIARLTLAREGNAPVLIETQAQRLTLRLSQTASACDVWPQPARHPAIASVRRHETGDDSLALALECPRLAGYEHWLDDAGRHLRVKALSPTPSDWRIALDPGHGGDETGATGLDGRPEKALNLTIALALRDALAEVGLTRVRLTRETDMAVPLAERAAAASQCEILLSLHHNALPDGRDPQAHCGVGGYFYHPFARALASHLQQALVRELGLPDDGLYENSLAMTRPTSCLAVLLELGYVTHPQDYARLIAPDFATRAAKVLAQALSGYAHLCA